MKKKLRSILALLMAILMVAACTACGSGGSGSTASGSSKLQEVLDRGYLIVGTGSTNAPRSSAHYPQKTPEIHQRAPVRSTGSYRKQPLRISCLSGHFPKDTVPKAGRIWDR